jgi:hypothetical protein
VGAGVATAGAGTLMGVIGSYPFAGFIKEEALQTLGLGVSAALSIGDFAGAEEAIAFQKELLNPSIWEQIKSKVPFVNVLNNLNDFYASAMIKLEIDERVVADLKNKVETGTTDAEMYAKIAEDRAAAKELERAEDAAYWQRVEDLKAAAKAEAREADARYWDEVAAKREKQEADKRRAELDYWQLYYKSLNEMRSNSIPSYSGQKSDTSRSNLNFGLLK